MAMSIEQVLDGFKSGIDGERLTEYLAEFSQHFNEIIQQGVLKKITTGQFNFDDVYTQADFFGNLASEALASNVLTNNVLAGNSLSGNATVNPQSLIEQQMQLMQDHARLWQQTALALFGHKPRSDDGADDVIKPCKGDTRFEHEAWRSNPIFDYIKQAYLLNARSLQDMAASLQFNDQRSAQQVRFWVRQFTNALAPTNFIATNPEVCRAIIESKGRNLCEGLQHFLRDLKASPENSLSVSMCGEDDFVLGENIATTPGAVIYQNELMQLIQYRPQTAAVFRIPILLCPAFINKYYILDLSPQNSLIDWLVKQGCTVFAMSWVNPDKSHADKTFTDYLLQGPVAARRVVANITDENDVIGMGYCVGGTLLACAQAYLLTRGEPAFQSTTYLATLLDFSNPGEVGAYISEEFVGAIERDPLGKGVFDGRIARLCFSLLRENNLYWSFFINNYLLGKDPAPLDLLHWNSDSTNVPMAMAGYYLRRMYLDNALIKAGGIVLNETPIDLGRIDTPAYFLSTQADHIALWQSCYLGSHAHGGVKRFVLAGSGHIAGVINPPSANKYGYVTNEALPADSGEWLRSSSKCEGSWWPDWLTWSRIGDGEKIAARAVGTEQYPILEDAPGSYARVRI